MQYNLTRIDPDAAVDRYPAGQRETVADPMESQVNRSIFMGKLEDVLRGAALAGGRSELLEHPLGDITHRPARRQRRCAEEAGEQNLAL